MPDAFLTIKQAAKLTGKSEVTVRRLIKRLLKNRTATTDKMITMTNRHGSSVYTINQTFLIEHANLSDEIKAQLLSASTQTPGQSNSQNEGDNAVASKTTNPTTPVSSGLDNASEQADYSTGPLNSQANTQPTSQPTHTEPSISSGSSNDNTSKPTQPVQPPNHVSGHFSENGLALLTKTIDRLSTQLDKKDNQIAEKDKQLTRLDTQLNDEKDQVKKLTQIIQQGNLLVHSAQQRIPIPVDENPEELIESSIVAEQSTEMPDDEVEPAPTTDGPDRPKKRGVFSTLFSQFGRSDN